MILHNEITPPIETAHSKDSNFGITILKCIFTFKISHLGTVPKQQKNCRYLTEDKKKFQ